MTYNSHNCKTVSLQNNRPHRFLIILMYCLLFHPNIQAQPTLTFNPTGQPPLNTNTHDGFIDEIFREILRRVGYQLIIDRHPAERGLHNANSGLIDGEMTRVKGIDKIYPNLLRVPEIIMDWEFVIFSEYSINLQNSWHSLANKNVAFITGWKILETFVPPTAQITRTKDAQQLFYLLAKKRTDFVIYERWGGLLLIKQANLSNVKIRQPALASKQMFMYLHKKHTDLIPKLSQALRAMKKDGSYDELTMKHLSIQLNRH